MARFTLPDGRELHVQVAGEEHDGPVVVLEAGAGAYSSAWAWIQPAIAEHYPVVFYDRAGLGWSDPSPNGPDAVVAVADLAAALDALGMNDPYVLVGHSMGTHYVRAFASHHPDGAAGVVLVDPSHEDQSSVLGEDYLAGAGPMAAALRVAAQFGPTRLYNPMAGDVALPDPQRRQYEADRSSVQWATSAGAEMVAIDRIPAQAARRDLSADTIARWCTAARRKRFLQSARSEGADTTRHRGTGQQRPRASSATLSPSTSRARRRPAPRQDGDDGFPRGAAGAARASRASTTSDSAVRVPRCSIALRNA